MADHLFRDVESALAWSLGQEHQTPGGQVSPMYAGGYGGSSLTGEERRAQAGFVLKHVREAAGDVGDNVLRLGWMQERRAAGVLVNHLRDSRYPPKLAGWPAMWILDRLMGWAGVERERLPCGWSMPQWARQGLPRRTQYRRIAALHDWLDKHEWAARERAAHRLYDRGYIARPGATRATTA